MNDLKLPMPPATAREAGRRAPRAARLGVVVWCVAVAGAAPAALPAQDAEAGRSGVEARDREAARPGTLRGRVVDATTERHITDAAVSLLRNDGERGAGATDVTANEVARAFTDARGYYAFEQVEPGTYRLRVERLGYRTADLWVEVPASWRVDRSVGLELAPVTLAPVDVRVPRAIASWSPSAPRLLSHAPGATEERAPRIEPERVVDAHSLDPRALPGTGALGESDVFRALQRLPGVSSRGDFAATLWTRGAPWGLAPVLLDGLPLFDPLHLGGLAAGITSESLGTVALFPGVQPPSRSVGAAGLVELSTATARPGPTSSASLSPLAASVRTEDRWFDDRLGLVASARRSWWDLLPGLANGFGGGGGPMDYYFADVSARGDWVSGDGTRLDWGLHAEEDHLDGGVRDIVATSAGRWGNRTAWLAAERDLGPARLTLRLGRVDHEAHTRPKPWYHFVRISGTPVLDHSDVALRHRTVRATLERNRAGEAWGWTVGYEWIRQSLSQFSLEARERALPGASGEVELERGLAWLEARGTVGDLQLAGGVAADLHTDPALDVAVIRPSGRVSWSPVERLVLEAASGVSRQFVYPFTPGVSLGPALTSGHFWVLADEHEKALTSWSRSIAAEVLLTPDLVARATLWGRTVEGFRLSGVAGLADGAPWPAAVQGDETGTERGRGYEVGLVWRPPNVQASAHYSRVRSTFEGGEVEPWTSPAERPHAFDLAFTTSLGGALDVGIDAMWESGWPLVRAPGAACPDEPGPCVAPPPDAQSPERYAYARAPAYVSLDLRAHWRATTGSVDWELSGAVRNLLGRENPSAYRAGTCQGAELISPVCEQPLGFGRFSPGLDRPTPTIAVRISF